MLLLGSMKRRCEAKQFQAAELALEERGPDTPVDFLFLLSPFLLVPPASPADLHGYPRLKAASQDSSLMDQQRLGPHRSAHTPRTLLPRPHDREDHRQFDIAG